MQSVGLTDVQDHYPNELSGGQQQRVSIARALITDPPIIFADEPTGSLDSETEQDVLLLIQSLNKTRGITFVIITHDDEVAQTADRMYRMHDGELTEGGVGMQFKDQIDFVRQHIKKNKMRVFMTVLAATMGTAFLLSLHQLGLGFHETMRERNSIEPNSEGN